jgi:hypothetical protein
VLDRCDIPQRLSRDYGVADGEGEALSLLLFFFDDDEEDEDDEEDFFFVALFSDALAEAAPPFLLPLPEVDAAAVEFWLLPGVLLEP